MWSSSKRNLILSNLPFLEFSHKKSDFYGTRLWFCLFCTHPQCVTACRDKANCYEYASRSAPTASEALGRTAGPQRRAHTYTHSWTLMDASKCANFLLQPHSSGELGDKAGRWVVLLQRLFSPHSFMFSSQPYFLGQENIPLQLSCWKIIVLLRGFSSQR